MRVAVGGLLHETNTFASRPTTYLDFEHAGIYRGAELVSTFTGTSGTLGGALDECARLGIEPVPLLSTFATPGGVVEHDAYVALREELLQRLRAAGKVDGVILAVHGAMVTDEEEDAEGDLLEAVRRELGEIPLVATLDLHGNLTPRMADACTAWVGYKTYPHVDYHPRAVEAVRILHDAVAGLAQPVLALEDIPILAPPQRMLTDEPPMAPLMNRAVELEARPDVLSVTVMGGFPYADVRWAGMAATAVCDGDREAARQICRELRDLAWELRDEFRHAAPGPAEGVAEAIAGSDDGPVALVDSSDNVGGGSAGDGTAVLAELLRLGARDAVCMLFDADAASEAARAGVGAAVELDVGGKTDDRHGDPVRVRGTVQHVGDGRYESERTGEPQSMGQVGVIRADGVEIVCTSRRVPAFDVAALRSVDIDPEQRRIIVVKGAVQWRSSYGRICSRGIEVDAPGVTRADLARLPYERVRRPIFPLDP